VKKKRRIGTIASCYGGVYASEENGKYYWQLADCSSDLAEEIPKELYDALVEFEVSTLFLRINKAIYELEEHGRRPKRIYISPTQWKDLCAHLINRHVVPDGAFFLGMRVHTDSRIANDTFIVSAEPLIDPCSILPVAYHELEE